MSRIEDRPITWKECETAIKADIQKLEKALKEGKEIALDDSFLIRSIISTFDGYGPSDERPVEHIHGVSKEFRLAICLEHSVSLVVSSLVQLYYKDRDLVYELDEQAPDIKVAQSILRNLVTFIGCYPDHFKKYGPKYEAVRRGCDAVYLGWHDRRARKPEVSRIHQCFFY